jgi:hypothetical protein
MGGERERERESAGWGWGGWESKVSAGSTPDPGFWHQMLAKCCSQRKLTRKSHVQEQGLMSDLGNMAQEEGESRPGMAFYRRGRVRGWHMCRSL